MNANEAMLKVAKMMADKYGYRKINVLSEIDATKDSFWGNQAMGYEASQIGQKLIVKTCRYELPVSKGEGEKPKLVPHIRIDMNWGDPRLSMYLPDNTFACLTYKGEEFSGAQAFKSGGLELATTLRNMIDEEINNNTL